MYLFGDWEFRVIACRTFTTAFPKPDLTLELTKLGNFIKIWISRLPSLPSEFTKAEFSHVGFAII